MKLTNEEERMLQGEYGYPIQQAMGLLTKMGDIYGAEKMVAIRSVHITQGDILSAGEAGAMYVEKLASTGGKFKVAPTINPAGLDFSRWQEMYVPQGVYDAQMTFRKSYEQLGAVMCYSCTPYHIGNVPAFGDHIAWSESSALIFANSVLGARTNREGAPACIAAALVSRAPLYGYHLEENRYGNVKVVVSAKLEDEADYAALGQFVGQNALNAIPVFTGIPMQVSPDELKALGCSLSGAGGITLFHAVGITPEARTEEQAFGGKRSGASNVIEFDERELKATIEKMQTTDSSEVDLVIFGCPHSSIYQIRDIAKLVAGKKINKSAEMWIYTSAVVSTYAERTGYKQIIEEAGGKILRETCPVKTLVFLKQINTIATNSQRGRSGRGAHFGSTRKCVEAAINGEWR